MYGVECVMENRIAICLWVKVLMHHEAVSTDNNPLFVIASRLISGFASILLLSQPTSTT